MPKVVCAPDKFRDAVTAAEAAAAMAAGAALAGWTSEQCPLADGGEGTREILLASAGGHEAGVASCDAAGRPAVAPFLLMEDGSAVIVAADIVGLGQLAADDRDPLVTSSYGLGAPVLAAVAAGAWRITVFVGGTANMDGGVGLLTALGALVKDAAGRRLRGSGAELAAIHRIDVEPARQALSGVELVVATDVDSPLYGPAGAAPVFGPQKGADAGTVRLLDRGMKSLGALLGSASYKPGAGAAGGLGAALMTLGATRLSGADLVMQLTGFANSVRGADLCITAEGSVDLSTQAGKAIAAVLDLCADVLVPCVVLGGAVSDEAESLYHRDAAGIFAIGQRPRTLARALQATAGDITATTRAICALASAIGPVSVSRPRRSQGGVHLAGEFR